MILKNIKQLCANHHVKISDLESAVGLGKNTIYKWSESSPSIANLKLVADYFEVTVDELLRGN